MKHKTNTAAIEDYIKKTALALQLLKPGQVEIDNKLEENDPDLSYAGSYKITFFHEDPSKSNHFQYLQYDDGTQIIFRDIDFGPKGNARSSGSVAVNFNETSLKTQTKKFSSLDFESARVRIIDEVSHLTGVNSSDLISKIDEIEDSLDKQQKNRPAEPSPLNIT